jgi:hypothetical protein
VSDSPYDPTDLYRVSRIHGFEIRTHPDLLRDEPLARDLAREVEVQLDRIVGVVPPRAVAELVEVPIWVEVAMVGDKAAEYHPAKDWLVKNGRNPEKAQTIEIVNAANFVKWCREDQPWALLHELAHAFHFRVLGEGHAGIRAAFAHAREAGLYDRVKYVRGPEKRAYALTNRFEYFAELSESLFGQNDFYPFNRGELAQHDPDGFVAVAQAWGMPLGDE